MEEGTSSAEVIQIGDSDSDSDSNSTDASEENGEIHEILSSDDDSEVVWIEESESEPDLDCETWDNDCKILTYTNENGLCGYHSNEVMFPIVTAPPEKKSKLCLEINKEFNENDFIKEFQENWNKDQSMITKDVELCIDPFKLCILQNFVSDHVFLNELRLHFNEIAWNKRNLDLYEFYQSKSLKSTDSEYLKTIYDFLNDDVRQWVSKLTDVELARTSASCSFYGDTDFLLVHDDLQEDRMFAFVLYLTGSDSWSPDWGGSLQLLNSDENGHPVKIQKCIYPANNQLVLFPVTNKSYHQVEEVVTKNNCRLTVNGWFHCSKVPKFNVPEYPPPKFGLFGDDTLKPFETGIDLKGWIKENYLQSHIMQQIQQHIEEYSEISLENFFIDSKFQDLVNQLDSTELKWKEIGPPNRRNYSILLEENLPDVLQEFVNMFKSKEMFSLLQQYTDLELKRTTAGVKYELQKWKSNSYSLLTDYKWDEKEELDVILYIGCKSGNIVGGRTTFVSLDEQIQDALITIEPIENNMNIIYRDSARYTQHVSRHSTIEHFYLLICTYSEC